MTIVGVCKFSGGGMQFTRDVNTTDGLFDITLFKNLNMFDLISNIRKLYNGHIVHHKKVETKVETYKTDLITVIPQASKPYIQADGELIGVGKVTFKIISKAINFVIR